MCWGWEMVRGLEMEEAALPQPWLRTAAWEGAQGHSAPQHHPAEAAALPSTLALLLLALRPGGSCPRLCCESDPGGTPCAWGDPLCPTGRPVPDGTSPALPTPTPRALPTAALTQPSGYPYPK